MPDDNLRYLSGEEKDALTLWRAKVESALALGGGVHTELMFWLAPMGAVFSGGQLSFPASKQSTRAAPWTGIEHYFNYVHARNYPQRYWSNTIATQSNKYFDYSKYNGESAYADLKAVYPAGSNILSVLNGLYDRVDAALKGVANAQSIVGGLLVLFETFAVWGTKWWESDAYFHEFYEGFAKSGTVGPYTVSVSYCNNGVIYGITMDSEPYYTAHQSIDAEILIQTEVQKSLQASALISAAVKNELDASLVLMARKDTTLTATIPLRGEVRKNPKAYLALQDEAQKPLLADQLLAATHQTPLEASRRLAATPLKGLDADICIIGPVLKPLTAHLLLLPDSASEMMTELEKYSIQSLRIKADPRSYKVFNSETDREVIP